MKNTAWSLGLAGLIPFVGLPLLATLDFISWYDASEKFVLYSAIILSFFGGIHWYDAISSNKNGHQMYIAMLPTIIGWLCLTQTGAHWVLGVLSASYVLMMFYDKQVLTLPKTMVVDYTKLRMTLTTIVVLSHAVMIFAR